MILQKNRGKVRRIVLKSSVAHLLGLSYILGRQIRVNWATRVDRVFWGGVFGVSDMRLLWGNSLISLTLNCCVD